MVNLQSEFMDFHNTIKLDIENATLREKRDILLKKLKEKISEDAASYTSFNQGSYAMGTGIKPDDGDYDIDVGLKFDIDHNDYSDPIEVKKWVKDALDGHTKKVVIRRSCVTVTYQEDGEDAYHVDFAVYAANNPNGKLYIAKGKENSKPENRYWEESDPQELIDLINSVFDDADDRMQFKRVIRYSKKWKNQHFDLAGNSAPTGIAITALAYNLFQPEYTMDSFSGKRQYDDFTAYKKFMEAIKNTFSYQWDSESQTWYYAISQTLPVAPGNNLFEKMTPKQQNSFHDKVVTVISKLEEAEKKKKRSDACKIMAEIFGNDFPVTVEKSYVGTSESA